MVLLCAGASPARAEPSLEYLGSFGGPVRHKVRHGKLGVVSIGSCYEILDCSDPARPRSLARRWVEGRVTGLDFTSSTLYLAVKSHGVRIVDLSDPAHPVDKGSYAAEETSTVFFYHELEIRGNTMRITGHYRHMYSSLETVDITDPWQPRQLDLKTNNGSGENDEEQEESPTSSTAAAIAPVEELNYEPPYQKLAGLNPLSDTLGLAFVDGRLVTIDITAPTAPKIIGSLPLKGGSTAIRDKTLIVSNAEGTYFIDIRNPARPALISSLKEHGRIGVDWSRTLVIKADETHFKTFDIADLKNPRPAGHFELPRPCEDFAIANHRAYMACLDLRIFNLADPAHPKLEGLVRCEDPEQASADKFYEGFRARDVALCGRYAFCENFLIDVANPKIPKIIGKAPVQPFGPGVNFSGPGMPLNVQGKWGTQNIIEYDNDNDEVDSRLDIYDLTNPLSPQQVYSLKGLHEDAWIQGDRLYLSGEESGMIVLKMYNVTHPPKIAEPEPKENTPPIRNVMEKGRIRLDFAGLKQIRVAGELACGRQGDRTLLTIDLTRPTQPRIMGRCQLPSPFAAMAIDGDTCFAGGTDGAVYAVDISKPAAPVVRSTFNAGEAPRAMAANGGRLYLATGKLKILDASTPGTLRELGTYSSTIPCTDLATSGAMVYLAARGLEIVDTANPAAPVLRHRWPSFPALGNRVLTYDYAQDGTVTQEIKRLGNIVYLVAISSADITRCQVLGFDVSNPDKPEGCGVEFEARGQDIDLKPETPSRSASRNYLGWMLGLPVKTQTADASRAGMMFYDVSEPRQPVFIGTFEGLADPRRPVLYKNLVYLPDERLGLAILSVRGEER